MPRILSVVAPGNGSGKTRLAVTILDRHPGAFAAVKFTTVYRDGEHCPKTEIACACRELHGRFTVITDEKIISQEGTDTGRMRAAGAARTLWCLSVPSAQGALWEHLNDRLVGPDERWITEGNRIVPILAPERIVMVVRPAVPRSRWKDDTQALMEAADLVIVNADDEGAAGASAGEAERLAGEISARTRTHVIVQDVRVPLQRWGDPALGEIVRGILGSGDKARPAATPGRG